MPASIACVFTLILDSGIEIYEYAADHALVENVLNVKTASSM